MAKEQPQHELTIEERMLAFQERQLAIQERQLELQERSQGIQKEQLKQTRRRSNISGALRSPFNPRGDKDYDLPALKCEMWDPFKVTDPHIGGFTREETELYNLVQPGEYKIKMNDGTYQTVCVVGTTNDETGQLFKLDFRGPRDEEGHHTGLHTKDRRPNMPATHLRLRMIINRDPDLETPGPADAVMTMREEVRRITLPVDDPKYLPISLGE